VNRWSGQGFSTVEEVQFVLAPQINPYRGPIFFDRSGKSAAGDNVITNGGFGLVDTGEKKLLVTCHHVWKAFQDENFADPNVRMCVCLDRNCPVVFAPSRPIDYDEILDIATFDMEPVLAACAEKKFYPLKQNPAPRLSKGDRLILLGDQGIFRSGTVQGLEFGVTTYAVEVSSVDGLRFHSDISKMKMRYVRSPAREPGSNPHGGISGSPCFLVRRNRPCQLVGFVTGHWTVQKTDYFCFTHARCLSVDGTIKRMTVP
jgi:hypothetical protein